ncbi:MAG: diguanylate cyclase domain-containing protein [Anaerolineaceae bacterium]
MVTLRTFDSNIVALLVLFIIYVDARSHLEVKFTLYNLFMNLVRLNIVLIVINLITWIVDGHFGFWNELFIDTSNLALFVIEPLASALWIMYADYLVFHDENRIQKQRKILSIPIIMNALASIMSLFTGWFFRIDEQNIYHRGDLYWVHMLLCVILMLFPFTFIFRNKKKVSKKHFSSLIIFIIPIAVGTTLQVLYYGVTYLWTGMTLSLLIVYLSIQERESSMDFLTEVFNRKQLDHYIKNKINVSKKQKPFSTILMDLDKFKEINDRYGHDIGDEALQDTVKVLRKCLRQNDFLARYGGDEFLLILDIDTPQMLKMAVQRIKTGFADFNKVYS